LFLIAFWFVCVCARACVYVCARVHDITGIGLLRDEGTIFGKKKKKKSPELVCWEMSAPDSKSARAVSVSPTTERDRKRDRQTDRQREN
jgi:hypothetical protein